MYSKTRSNVLIRDRDHTGQGSTFAIELEDIVSQNEEWDRKPSVDSEESSVYVPTKRDKEDVYSGYTKEKTALDLLIEEMNDK